jgi:hypothetical protein
MELKSMYLTHDGSAFTNYAEAVEYVNNARKKLLQELALELSEVFAGRENPLVEEYIHANLYRFVALDNLRKDMQIEKENEDGPHD